MLKWKDLLIVLVGYCFWFFLPTIFFLIAWGFYNA